MHLCWRAGTLKFFEDPSRSARNARGVAAGARPGGRGQITGTRHQIVSYDIIAILIHIFIDIIGIHILTIT